MGPLHLHPSSHVPNQSVLVAAERASYLKGEVGTGTEGMAVQPQDTKRMVRYDKKHTTHLNVTLTGRIQYQNPKATRRLRQILQVKKLRLCIISTAVFGCGHHNSNSPSKLANNPTPKSKNSRCARKYCSELRLRKSYRH